MINRRTCRLLTYHLASAAGVTNELFELRRDLVSN